MLDGMLLKVNAKSYRNSREGNDKPSLLKNNVNGKIKNREFDRYNFSGP